MPVVPVIIPFYKELEKLRRCQAAIAAQTYPHCETFVRDNTHDNILYTAAVNEGLAKYCYRDDVPYVLVLNQDAYMDKNCVQRLVEFMNAHPDCGIASPVQYADAAAPDWRGTAARALGLVDRRTVTWAGSLQAFPSGVHRTGPLDSFKDPFETYWANGACMLIRTRTVRECGLFDRNMRFVCSDSDFSFTVRARGWKVVVVPQALCQHSLGASGEAGSPEILLVKSRDMAYFTEKWLTGGLYRQLAAEGPLLTPITVRQWLARMRHDVRSLERRLGRTPPAAGLQLPSMLVETSLPPQEKRAGRF